MGEVAWMELSVWPWRNEWLQQDADLAGAFREAGLLADGKLTGAMNGQIDFEQQDGYVCVEIAGEMSGGSYKIRSETTLLEALRDRDIAYRLEGDGKYEWDADEVFWHPGMREPFDAQYSNGGRVISEQAYKEMLARSMSADERADRILVQARDLDHKAKQAQHDAEHALEGESGTFMRDQHLARARTFESLAVACLGAREVILDERPAPIPVADQVAEFFSVDWQWTPPADWQPKLVLAEEEE